MSNNEGMAYLLAPSAGGRVGPEKPKKLSPDVTVHVDRVGGSFRFVKHVGGQPVAALQVMKRDGRPAIAANVFTAEDHRRKGHATDLARHAKTMFPDLTFSDDRSEAGDAWAKTAVKLARLTATKAEYKPGIFGGDVNEHLLHDEAGNHVATVRIYPLDDGKHLHVDRIARPGATVKSGDPAANTLGPEAMRTALGAVLEHYPEAQFISGRRVSGHRGNTSRQGERVVLDANKLRNAVKKLARAQVPAEGAIIGGGTQTGGTFQQGGQFAAKARKRIRQTVLAWLSKRVQLSAKKTGKPLSDAAKSAINKNRSKAKTPGGDLTQADLHFDKPGIDLAPDPKEAAKLPSIPAPDVAIHKAKDRSASDAAGGDPDVVAGPNELRKKLTIRELKDVENSLNLPHGLRLSHRHGNADKLDGEEVADLDHELYYKWANGVARHIQNTHLTPSAAARVRDPKHLSRARLAFITSRLTREAEGAKATFADTGGAAKWYGDHVAAMSRHLHETFHNKTPEDDELWGKLDPKTGRVHGGAAVTLAKMLVAATSGGMKPHENYDTAHAMMTAGRAHAKGSPNIFKTIPENQYEDFSDWVNRATKWHEDNKTGVTRHEILNPGASLHDRGLWYERVMRPMKVDKTLNNGGTNSAARYSGVKAEYVTDQGPHFGMPVSIDKGKQGWKSPYPSTTGKSIKGDAVSALPAPGGHPDFGQYLADTYRDNGGTRKEKLPAVDQSGRLQPPGWTSRNDQVMDGVNKINAVVSYFTDKTGNDREGMKQAAHFMLNGQPESAFTDVILHTGGLDKPGAPSLKGLAGAKNATQRDKWIDEVAAWHEKNKTGVSRDSVATAARLYEATQENRGFYYPGDPLPGSFLLGPKFGAFTLNLHLDQPNSEHLGEHLTADLWWSRDWNVMLGSLFGPNNETINKKDGRTETPRGKGSGTNPERKVMRKAAQLAARAAGLNNVAELQAVLWYYEQQKPKWFGVDTSSTSYHDGVDQVAERSGLRYCIHKTTGAISVIPKDQTCPT